MAQPGEVTRVLWSVNILLFSALPLGLALEPARASSKCDRLVDSLNQVSLNELEENRDLWLSLDRIITTWNRTNRGQGVGFVVGGTVVDKRKLRSLAVVLYSFLWTAISYSSLIMVYVPRSGVDTLALEDACELTEAQLVSIRAAMFGRNASCSYNMTVGSALIGD